MTINLHITNSGIIENCEPETEVEETELPEEHSLYALIPEKPSDNTTIYYQEEFYSIHFPSFSIENNDCETAVYVNGNRIPPSKTANPGTIKSVSHYTIRRCRPGYHLERRDDGHGHIYYVCVRNR